AEGGGEVMAQHIFAPVPAPSSIAPVTSEIEQFLLRALAKDPAHRFPSAEEMSAALQMAVPTGSFPRASGSIQLPHVPAHPPLVPVPTQQTTLSTANATARTAPSRRKLGWIAPVVAVVAIAGGATAISISRRGGGSASTVKAPEPASLVPESRL